MTANVVKFICIELDKLTWLMTNPFVASVFGSQKHFHIQTGGMLLTSANVVGFLNMPPKVFTNLFIYLFYYF